MIRRAFLAVAVALITIATAYADEPRKYRVAAIIFTEQDSKALIEDASGVQAWFEVGELLGASTIDSINVDSVTLTGSSGRSILTLRRSKRASQTGPDNISPPATVAAKPFRYVALISEIAASEAGPGESQAAADALTMNRVLGLADKARITAIGRVKVATAAEARVELQQRLTLSEPIRITIAGDELEELYVMPD